MLRNKHGQSIIEYTIMAVLVIIGIVVMGPYVLRSVNSHFKMWDDQAQDSTNERLKQTSINAVTIPSNCTCSDTFVKIPGACGSGNGSVNVSCLPNQILTRAACEPVNCYFNERCEYDDSCCIYERGNCGTLPIPAGGLSTRQTTPITPAINFSDGGRNPIVMPLVFATGSTQGNCYFGERMVLGSCGLTPQRAVGCIVDTFGRNFDLRNNRPTPVGNPNATFSTDDDDASCSPICHGNLAHGALCTTNDGAIDIPADLPLKAMGQGTGACAGDSYKKCEFYCIGDFVPSGDGKQCVIKFGFIVPLVYSATTNYSFDICTNDPGAILSTSILPIANCPKGTCCLAEIN